MSRYQMKPKLGLVHMLGVVGIAVGVMAAPVVANSLIPGSMQEPKPVEVKAQDSDWKVPLTDAQGNQQQCDVDTMNSVFGDGWDCPNYKVGTIKLDDVEDKDQAMRRMARAFTSEFSVDNDAKVKEERGVRTMLQPSSGSSGIGDPNYVMVAVDGTGDHEGEMLVAFFEGPGALQPAARLRDKLLNLRPGESEDFMQRWMDYQKQAEAAQGGGESGLDGMDGMPGGPGGPRLPQGYEGDTLRQHHSSRVGLDPQGGLEPQDAPSAIDAEKEVAA